jgi:hypothetical protein
MVSIPKPSPAGIREWGICCRDAIMDAYGARPLNHVGLAIPAEAYGGESDDKHECLSSS